MAWSGEVLSLPILITVVSGTSIVVLVITAYCTYRCWRARRPRPSGGSTPDSGTPQRLLNLTISQSTPDLVADDPKAELVHNEEKIGKSHFKTVIKQSTLPTVPQRHQSFQRQLSNKLDLSNVEFTIQSVKYKEQPVTGKIRPELYRQDASASHPDSHTSGGGGGGGGGGGEPAPKTCGKLEFAVHYEHNLETLRVSVLRAEGLPAKDFSGTSDPYVKVYLLPDRKFKYQTKVHRKTLNPLFDETFEFRVAYTELTHRALQFSIYDFDRFSRHDLIGVVLVRDLIKSQDLSWQQVYMSDIIMVQQEKVDLGELMLSLCYLPTAGRLTVTIIKARNLKAMDITGTSDPYVKISLMCHGRRIKKKKTSVKRATLNPVYNEAIVFDVPQENIEEVSLIIKVIDYDRVGSNELMGCCAVGNHYLGPGREHWGEMMESARKPVAQWYTLQENVPGASQDHTPNGKNATRVK